MTSGFDTTTIKAQLATQNVATQPTVPSAKISQQATQAFKLGQILQAVTLSNTQQGKVNVQIGQQVFNASSNIPLKQNTPLALKVVQLQPQLLLQLTQPPMPATASALQQALPQLLPQQGGYAPLLTELAQKLQPGSQTQQNAGNRDSTNSLKLLADSLLKAIPERQALLKASGLQQAIRDSGLFLESRLSQHQGGIPLPLSKDLKTLLLRYQQALSKHAASSTGTGQNASQSHNPQNSDSKLASNLSRTLSPTAPTASTNTPIPLLSIELAPPLKGRLPVSHARVMLQPQPGQPNQAIEADLLKLQTRVESILSRLSLLQIATAENFNDGHMLWQLEIPVKQGNAVDILAMTIERKKNGNADDDDDAWTVQLALELPNLGTIDMRVSLNQQIASTSFWSESESTLKRIESQADALREHLGHQGIKLQDVHCHFGKPQAVEVDPNSTAIIDCQA